jgi:2,4-dienoyl-CoA reductase-like NADH-dependent reductase (Old Yellow Enzyme family)
VVPDPFAPARLGPVTLRNRVIKAATFEGMSPRNLPTPALVDYHRAVAAGGVGMTTLGFCAVSRDGRGARGELVVSEEAIPGLRALADAVHAEGAKVSAQLGHAGPVAAASGIRGLAPTSGLRPLATAWARAADDADLARVTRDFAAAARRVAAAGFDAIELHLGHHYLLSAFLSPRLNRRDDAWGGDVQRRARFPRQVVAAVRDAVGHRVAVTAKLQMTDGVRGGLELDDAIATALLLEADGHLDALELTGGGSLLNPMYLFRGDVPRWAMAATLPQWWLRLGFAAISPWLMRRYPFEEAYFLPFAMQFRAALTMPLILLGGINRRDTIDRAMAEGFAFVAMGRALLREPDLVRRLAAEEVGEGRCTHCNACMATIYGGTHCVLVAPGDRPGFRVTTG